MLGESLMVDSVRDFPQHSPLKKEIIYLLPPALAGQALA